MYKKESPRSSVNAGVIRINWVAWRLVRTQCGALLSSLSNFRAKAFAWSPFLPALQKCKNQQTQIQLVTCPSTKVKIEINFWVSESLSCMVEIKSGNKIQLHVFYSVLIFFSSFRIPSLYGGGGSPGSIMLLSVAPFELSFQICTGKAAQGT